jgi:hypothetical protein
MRFLVNMNRVIQPPGFHIGCDAAALSLRGANSRFKRVTTEAQRARRKHREKFKSRHDQPTRMVVAFPSFTYDLPHPFNQLEPNR